MRNSRSWNRNRSCMRRWRRGRRGGVEYAGSHDKRQLKKKKKPQVKIFINVLPPTTVPL